MISDKELKKELKATKAFLKYLNKTHKGEDFPEVQGYIDGLTYAMTGKLE
jgi:hypothetical protein